MRDVRCLLVGLGNLGRRFCEILMEKDALLRERYDLALHLVGAADSQGAVYEPQGLDLQRIVDLKLGGGSVVDYGGGARRMEDAVTLVEEAEADLLLEASPVNLEQGAEPGLSCIRAALRKGMHVSTPNKGPLVVAYRELHELAAEKGVKLRFDGTVTGGLPSISVGRRELRGAVVQRMEAVPNLVTGYIMDLIAEGLSWEEAIAQAGNEGVLEADASWDLEGWDAAAKLVILANAVLDYPTQLEAVPRTGITALEADDLRAAQERGYHYRLLAQAERVADGNYAFSVAPVPLSPDHPLSCLGRKQMGVVFVTDIYGTIVFVIDEPTPVPSAASMLRDILDIYVETE